MKKIQSILIGILVIIGQQVAFASYTPDEGTKNIMIKYNIAQTVLNKPLDRKTFIEILSRWYPGYSAQKGHPIDLNTYKPIDNKKYFKDVDLESEFGKKLQYFAGTGAIKKAALFNPKNTFTQKDFFTVMNRLNVMTSLQHCRTLNICEQETSLTQRFTPGVYLKYVSKIMDKSLRKHQTAVSDYIDLGYKPYLSPDYSFPLRPQTLNACYFFSVRNIIRYKYGKELNIAKLEKEIGKDRTKLSYTADIIKFNDAAGVIEEKFRNIESLFANLQNGEPLSISYMIEAKDKNGNTIKIPHVVAAYSFDKEGIWVAETVSNKHKRIPYAEVFKNGKSLYNPMRKFQLSPEKI